MSGRLLEGLPTFDIFRAQRVDETDPDNVYIGYAKIGSLSGDAVWAILRIQRVGGTVLEFKWASGNNEASKVWDNRATAYTYT